MHDAAGAVVFKAEVLVLRSWDGMCMTLRAQHYPEECLSGHALALERKSPPSVQAQQGHC